MSASTFPRESTNSLRGAIQLLIVASHLSFVFPEALPFVLANKLGTTIVALFFFISGFGLYQAHKNQAKRQEGAPKPNFFTGRILPVLRPMLYLTLIYLGWEYVYRGDTSNLTFHPWEIIKNLFLYGDTRLPNSWFVYMLAILYTAFYISFRYSKRPMLVLFALSLISVWGLAWADFARNWWITNLAFFSGVVYAQWEQQIYQWLSKYVSLIGILLIVGLLIKINIVALLPLAYLLIPMTIVVYLHRWGYSAWIVDSHRGKYIKLLLYWLSSISFELYLIHGFVINLLRPLGLSMWVYSALVFVLSLLLAWLYKQVLALLSRYGL